MSVRNLHAWRAALALVACTAITGLLPRTAHADPRAPWCVDTADLGAGLQCNYFSLEECQIAARGVSNICAVNPYYVPAAAPVHRQYRGHRRYR
jgi:hypothetical protein